MHAVVIGGGIVGTASAYHLRERGVDVTLLERDEVGAGMTERAGGGIRAQFAEPVNVDLSLAALPTWEAFEERFGVDVGFRRSGYLFLARERDLADRLRANVAMQNDRGVPSEYLDPEAAAERCPGLEPGAFEGAAYSPRDALADPAAALGAYADAAREAGATFREGVAVTDVLRGDDGVTGVETTAGRIDADFVVNAAGPWAGEVAAMAGIDLPIEPLRRSTITVESTRPVETGVPLTVDIGQGVFFRPVSERAVALGGGFAGREVAAPDGFDSTVDPRWRDEVRERAAEFAGHVDPDSRVVEEDVGLYTATPDNSPVIEETAPGFVNAVGFSGHGFMQAPATARVVADLIVGDEPPVDVADLSAGRFGTDAQLDEWYVI